MRSNEARRTDELIAAGWGCATINPNSIQADNGAGLTRGIIGLTNLGQPRNPDDWGSLRAWAWGASRGLDRLQTDSRVDGKRVGIEGVSRYGKATLVTMAFDQRFAMALVGSSGAGGATPHRRNFGEAVENLTGSGEYHWMAGNFLKYGAEESRFGSTIFSNSRFLTNRIFEGGVTGGFVDVQAPDGLSSVNRPGTSPGSLMIDANLRQRPTGSTVLEIAGLLPDIEHDVLMIAGDAELDGTLVFEFIDGFAPQAGGTKGPGGSTRGRNRSLPAFWRPARGRLRADIVT